MPVAQDLIRNSLIIWMPSGVFNLLVGRVTKSVKYFESGGGSFLDPIHTIPTQNPCIPHERIQASVGGLKAPTITGRIGGFLSIFLVFTGT
jgi:hypothetical protein